jgi:predicted Zn finger-like uncharacterized protein
MAIQVVCPKCKTSFKVSDKFAGKQGPCPKCKATITVPAATEEIKIHGPEEMVVGGKSVGVPTSTKPIPRQEARLRPVPTAIAVGGTLLVLVGAWAGRKVIQDQIALRAVCLVLISGPVAWAGYAFLREEEIEPHQGAARWLRSALCGAAYSLLWGALYLLAQQSPGVLADSWNWVWIAPPLFFLGAGAAWLTLDLDLANGFFHYCFYVFVTLAVAAITQLQMPWTWTA